MTDEVITDVMHAGMHEGVTWCVTEDMMKMDNGMIH